MGSWQDVVDAEPELARRVREVLDAHKHKTIATLRKDGGPRISGIEIEFHDGEVWFGSMPDALKARDLRRDPRFALHCASVMPADDDPSSWPGDAKVAGVAVEVTDRGEIEAILRAHGHDPAMFEGSHLFRADLREVVLTRVVGDHLEIDLWQPGQGLRRFQRR
jgi:general stress protein 26